MMGFSRFARSLCAATLAVVLLLAGCDFQRGGASTIRVGLPEKAEVEVTVYDVMGRQVAHLAEGVKAAGFHEVPLDASDWPSGVYVYPVRAGTPSAPVPRPRRRKDRHRAHGRGAVRPTAGFSSVVWLAERGLVRYVGWGLLVSPSPPFPARDGRASNE